RREDKPRPHSDGDERRLPRSERDRDEGAHLQHERTGGRVPQEDEEAERDRGLDDRRRRWLVSRTDHGTDDLDPDDERDDAGDDELGPGRQTRERPELGQSAPESLGTTGARARVLHRPSMAVANPPPARVRHAPRCYAPGGSRSEGRTHVLPG